MSWTDEKIAELKRLWLEGKSTGEIGKIIGMSKNAVVGKAHRLGLESRPSPIKRSENAEGVKAEAPKAAKAEKTVKSDKTEKGDSANKTAEVGGAAKKYGSKGDSGKGVTLVDLNMHTCRWPIGDPKDPDFHFCGKEVELGKPYCEEHLAQAFVGIKR
jgi:GcrA cell cycle regulator